MKIRYSTNPSDAKYYTTEEIRQHYLIDDLFEDDQIKKTRIETTNIFGITPKKKSLSFETNKGILIVNTSGIGIVKVNGEKYTLDLFQTLIVKSNVKIEIKCVDEGIITRFLAISLNYEETTKLIDLNTGYENNYFQTGLKSINNSYQDPFIHNALQIYLYSDLYNEKICHIFGKPEETRHIFLNENEVFISPSWSVVKNYGVNKYKMFYFIIKEEKTNVDIEDIL